MGKTKCGIKLDLNVNYIFLLEAVEVMLADVNIEILWWSRIKNDF